MYRDIPYCVPANDSSLDKLNLCIIIDTEEEFNWNAPFTRNEHAVDSIKSQHYAQDIFSKFNVKPTYLADFPIIDNPAAVDLLRGLKDKDQCEIGVQLHPWTNPPYEEELSKKNSFLCNLPVDLITRKIEFITEKFIKEFQYNPTIFKAGRYGIDETCFNVIKEFGYEIDTSVVPHTTYSKEGGPDFTSWPDSPFWLDDDRIFLELPITRGFSGLLRSTATAQKISAIIDSQHFMTRRIPSIFARGNLLERITLTPEGVDHQAHRRLIKSLMNDGRKLFCFSYHSASLLPGSTPYVRNKADLDIFLQRIELFLQYFTEKLHGRVVTPHQAADLLRNAAAKN